MKKYALLGQAINYSWSKKIHETIARIYNLDLSYEVINCQKNHLGKYFDKLSFGDFYGFNVTIPYKESVIPFLDCLTGNAKKISAVNTIYLLDDLIVGDNTDYDGFKALVELNHIEVNNKVVYILGSGGAAKACYHVLNDLGAIVTVVRRKMDLVTYGFNSLITYEEIDPQKVDIFVNATPVGTYPNTEESILPKEMIKDKVVIDLVYNPEKTLFMKYAKKSYGGIDMLIVQAIKSEAIWQGKTLEYDLEIIKEIEREIRK